jgi:hypothetical protein
MGKKWNNKKGSGGGRRKGVSKYGRAKSTRVPRPIDMNQGTLFPIVRTSLLSTDSNGVLDQVFAIGNVSILGPASQVISPTSAAALTAVAGVAFPSMLDSIRQVFQNMRVVSHSIQFLPICAGGSSDQPASPIEFVYSRYGIDGGGNTTAATALSGYGSNQYSTLLSPSDNRMASYSKTFYPTKSSLNSQESYPIPASSTATVLNQTTGNQGSGRTLGFLKIYSSDLGKTAAGASGGSASVVSPYIG